MSQILSSSCANCFHGQESHPPEGICRGSISCLCQKFVPSELVEFAQEVERFKSEYKKVYQRCKFILTKIPPSRNASDKSFPKIYKEIFHGIKIRKTWSNLNTDLWKAAPSDDRINRAKRLVKHENPELATYDKKVLFEQTALYQALMEMAIGLE